MPIEIACPECHAVLRVSEQAVGKRAKCKMCGHVIPVAEPPKAAISTTPPDDDAEDEISDEDARNSQKNKDKEPWFYGFCYSMSVILLGVTIAVAVGAVIVGFVSLFAAMAYAKDSGSIALSVAAAFFYVMPTLIALLFAVYGFSFVLVFVDASRHVRRIYYKETGE